MGAAWLLTSIGFAVVLQWPGDRALARWDQPGTVSYGSNDPYVLHIKDNSSWWNGSGRGRYCRVWVVSHGAGDLLYGHCTEYQFHNYRNDPDYFTQCRVAWEPEGVAITEPTGHQLFIPKKAFIGGR